MRTPKFPPCHQARVPSILFHAGCCHLPLSSAVVSTAACCDAHLRPEVRNVGEALSWALTIVTDCLGVLLYVIADAPTKCSNIRARCNRSAFYAPQLLRISRELYCDMDSFFIDRCVPSVGFIRQLTAHTTSFPARVPLSNTLLPVKRGNTSWPLRDTTDDRKTVHHYTRSKSEAADASSLPGTAGPANILPGH